MTGGQFLHKKFSVMWLKAVCFFIWEICNVIGGFGIKGKAAIRDVRSNIAALNMFLA